MPQKMVRSSQTQRPLSQGGWLVAQRWNDLLFANWPVSAASIAPLLPEGLHVDSFQGSAWLGVMPYWMDRLKIRYMPPIFGARSFPNLSVRTYVHDQQIGTPGVYFLSLDASNLLAAAVGRGFYHLPYHWAKMYLEQRKEREFDFYSRRRLAARPMIFQARYRGLGPTQRLAENRAGTLENFLMERYCLFSKNHAGQPIRANLHYVRAQLEEAEAQIEKNDLAAVLGIQLPDQEPELYYIRRLAVYVGRAEPVQQAPVRRPVAVAVTPSA